MMYPRRRRDVRRAYLCRGGRVRVDLVRVPAGGAGQTCVRDMMRVSGMMRKASPEWTTAPWLSTFSDIQEVLVLVRYGTDETPDPGTLPV